MLKSSFQKNNIALEYGAILPPTWDRDKNLNWGAVLITLLIPPSFFSVVCWLFAFSTQYHADNLYLIFFLVLGGIGACVVGGLHIKSRLIAVAQGGAKEMTWYMLLSLTTVVAWIFGILCGAFIYVSFMRDYYNYMSLNMYSSVNPAKATSTQVLDVGIITFAEGVQLDMRMSAAYTLGDTYCVVPIVQTIPANVTYANYDFWAVGINCCGGDMHEFNCDASTNPYAHAGLRVLPSAADEFYKLALRSASEKFGIQAERPLLFQWVQDPTASIHQYEENGFDIFMLLVFTAFGSQLFLILVSLAAAVKNDV